MSRREIHAEIAVDAPPEHVWNVLTDFERYARWNPFMREASGRLHPGETLRVRIDLPGQLDRVFTPRVVTVTPRRELTWMGRLALPRLFDGEHSFFVEPLDEGRRTLVIQHENFSGLLLPLFTTEMEAATRRGFQAMNAALGREAERPAHAAHPAHH
jgi:hypothetical protein